MGIVAGERIDAPAGVEDVVEIVGAAAASVQDLAGMVVDLDRMRAGDRGGIAMLNLGVSQFDSSQAAGHLKYEVPI
uniref:Uncharacterized protein n=1 Tax=Bosea sp. NBC_00436 TaxID=2969620 RepID=A0A9E7ZLJ6_9HYPH